MALFDNIEEIKQYNSSITMSLSLASLQSFIDQAIDDKIVGAIGKPMLSELLKAKTAGIVPDSTMSQLLNLAQKACAHFAMANYTPFGSVLLSDAGAHVHSDTNLRPASDAKLDALRNQALVDGYAALEDLVGFLEEHLSVFPIYAKSDAHRANTQLFINSSKEFNTYMPVRTTAQLFVHVRSEIGHTERDTIEPLLGDDLMADLRSKISGSKPLSNEDKKLLKHIKRVVAPLSLAATIPYGCIRISTNGLCQLAENTALESPAETSRMQQVMLHLTTRGERELQELRSFLDKKHAASPSYNGKEVTKPSTVNTANSRVYLM